MICFTLIYTLFIQMYAHYVHIMIKPKMYNLVVFTYEYYRLIRYIIKTYNLINSTWCFTVSMTCMKGHVCKTFCFFVFWFVSIFFLFFLFSVTHGPDASYRKSHLIFKKFYDIDFYSYPYFTIKLIEALNSSGSQALQALKTRCVIPGSEQLSSSTAVWKIHF